MIARLKSRIVMWLVNGSYDSLENVRKTIFLNIVLVLAMFFNLLMIVFRIITHDYSQMHFAIIGFAVSAISLAYFKKYKNVSAVSILIVLALSISLIMISLSGQVFHMSKVMIYAYPLIVLFLIEIKNGKYFIGFLFLFYLASYFLVKNIEIVKQTKMEMYSIVATYFTISAIALVYEYLRFFSQKKIEMRSRQLYEIVEKMKISEKALKESNTKLSQFYDVIPAAVYTVDCNKIITSINSKACEILGYTAEEIIGEECGLFAIEPCQNYCGIFGSKEFNPIFGKICTVRNKSGDIRTIRKNADYIKDETGGVIGAVESFEDITDFERIDLELRQSREEYQNLIMNSGEGIGIVDLNEVFIFANPAAEEVFGVERGNLAGRSIKEFLYEEDFIDVKEQTKLRMRGDKSTYTLNIVRPSKEIRTIQITATPRYDKHRNIFASIGIFRDITEQKKIVDLVMDERNRAQMYFDTADVIMMVLDIAGNVVNINRKGCDIIGYDKDFIVGKNWFENFIPDRAKELLLKFDKQFKSGVITLEQYHENPIKTKYGEERNIAWHNVLLKDSSGNIVGTLSSGEDITEKLMIDEKLKKLSTAVEQSSSCVIITDVSGKIEYVNPKIVEISGYSMDEMIGQDVAMFSGGAKDKDILKNMWKRILSGEEWHGEFYNMRKDKSRYWVFASISAIKDKDSKITNFISIQDDISERKMLEEALIKAKDDAEKATKVKSEFLANMSHEIRTPMNGIIGMSEIILSTDLNNEQREYLKLVKSSGESLLSLINGILDFSKIEAGKIEIENIEFDFRREIENAVRPIAIDAYENGLEFIVDIDEAIPKNIIADSVRLKQIIINLAGNSLKFTSHGEIYLKAVTENDKLTISIEDTGIGIPDDKLEHIFEPFVQADGSITRRFGGTGLGTTISKKFVDLMGGEISVKSPSGLNSNGQGGRGTTFIFTIPYKKTTVIFDEKKEECTLEKILIICDNVLFSDALKRMLYGIGIKSVKCIKDRTEFNADDYDMFLIDGKLENETGFEIADMVLNKRKNAKIIMMLMPSDLSNCLKLCSEKGISRYVIKPVFKSNLEDKILKSLRQSGKSEENKSSAIDDIFKGKRILLAEDNFVNQKVALTVLKKLGIYADVAKNGLEALDALRKNDYSLVLMDIQMPEMDGVEATRRIRDYEKGISNEKFAYKANRIPIIAMTAYAVKGEREILLAEGVDDYLSKPFRMEELISLLKKYLN